MTAQGRVLVSGAGGFIGHHLTKYLVQTLERLITDSEQRQKMGAAGRRYAVEHYGLDMQADKLAAALREAASLRN